MRKCDLIGLNFGLSAPVGRRYRNLSGNREPSRECLMEFGANVRWALRKENKTCSAITPCSAFSINEIGHSVVSFSEADRPVCCGGASFTNQRSHVASIYQTNGPSQPASPPVKCQISPGAGFWSLTTSSPRPLPLPILSSWMFTSGCFMSASANRRRKKKRQSGTVTGGSPTSCGKSFYSSF